MSQRRWLFWILLVVFISLAWHGYAATPSAPHQTWTVDRFEGRWAVIELGDAQDWVEVPRAMLPAGVTEGSRLHLEVLPPDPVRTRDAASRRRRLIMRMDTAGTRWFKTDP